MCELLKSLQWYLAGGCASFVLRLCVLWGAAAVCVLCESLLLGAAGGCVPRTLLCKKSVRCAAWGLGVPCSCCRVLLRRGAWTQGHASKQFALR